MTKMKKILICGSRDYTDKDAVLAILQYNIPFYWQPFTPYSDIEVIHGGARGADTLGAEFAKELGYGKITEYPAEWDKYGKRAGMVRNIEMLEQNPDLVIAFGTGKGTNHTVKEAEKRGITVKRIP